MPLAISPFRISVLLTIGQLSKDLVTDVPVKALEMSLDKPRSAVRKALRELGHDNYIGWKEDSVHLIKKGLLVYYACTDVLLAKTKKPAGVAPLSKILRGET